MKRLEFKKIYSGQAGHGVVGEHGWVHFGHLLCVWSGVCANFMVVVVSHDDVGEIVECCVCAELTSARGVYSIIASFISSCIQQQQQQYLQQFNDGGWQPTPNHLPTHPPTLPSMQQQASAIFNSNQSRMKQQPQPSKQCPRQRKPRV